jgi:hypothetical protein
MKSFPINMQLFMKAPLLLLFCLLATNSIGQLPKIPKLSNVITPSSDSKVAKDESGLFSNCTSNDIAYYKRRDVAGRLNLLEAEYQKNPLQYGELTKLVDEIEKYLSEILALEPSVNRSKFDARYLPLKQRADKDLPQYAKLEAMAKKLTTDFYHQSNNFYRPSSGDNPCYCGGNGKKYSEFESAKKEFQDQAKLLAGYPSRSTDDLFSRMESCQKKASEEVNGFATVNLNMVMTSIPGLKANQPERVIQECSDYLEKLERMESDPSLNFDASTRSAIENAKATVTNSKTESETYISSGEFQKYRDQLHAEKIAKVTMPQAKSQNAALEAKAVAHVKGEDYGAFIKREGHESISTTLRAVTTTSVLNVRKNEYDYPKYSFQSVCVAYKTTDGKCYITEVEFRYEYIGGGTYSNTAEIHHFLPTEIACQNVTK